MSGNMYEHHPHKLSSWNSNVNVDYNQDDACSQFSEDLGTDVNRPLNIGQRLRNLFKNQQYTDVKFIVSCGVKPKPTLEAHRAILAAGSKKFADMLYGENSSSIAKDIHPEIQINNISFEAFKNVVEFLYTDDVYFCSDASVMETLNAAKTFLVQPLVGRCESYFESAEITEANACARLQLSIAHKMDSLKNRCTQFIQEYTRAVISSHDFKSAAMSTVRTICKLPKFNLRSEKELFDALLNWVDAQPLGRSKRRELLEPFMKNIRFLTIPLAEFTAIVHQCEGENIFSAKEALDIVMYLSNPGKNAVSVTLPTWCNKGTASRCALVNVPARPANRGHIADQKVTIALRQINRGYVNKLICVVDMKCLKGCYQIKGLKLAFGGPVTEHSCIGHLSIDVRVLPCGFNFVEHCKIDNSKEVVITFSKPTFVKTGDTLHVQAEANEIRGYNFMQFDEENSFQETTAFECHLGSVPKENRLFFIQEVLYIATQRYGRQAGRAVKNFRGGKPTPECKYQ